MLSDVMEDYLKAIYFLQDQEEGEERVRTSKIADYLDVEPPTVTSMVKKLSDSGLVDYEEYRGVRLTQEGEPVALEIVRHHRLLETYLTEHLDYDWSEVHEEADRLEHHISEKFAKRVAERLENPSVDPHGDPIPDEDLEPLEEGDDVRLSECTESSSVVVNRVDDHDPEVLEYLSENGIDTGTEIDVVEVAPFDVITVDAGEDGTEVSLSDRIAQQIMVEYID
ncbi:MAG: metal-dependent transcriptional regulator [Halobacteria archaeon]